MDTAVQLAALDRFLTATYGEEMTLGGMIEALGFDPEQSRLLREDCLQTVAEELIDAVRRKLTLGERDLWFRLLCRRFGLDGEPGVSLDEAARVLNVDAGYASQAESDALERCRTKRTREDFRKEVHRIAVRVLSQGSAKPQRAQVVSKLERLADLRAAVDLTRMDYETKKAKVLEKVQAELDALDAEYEPLLEAAEGNALALESEIKNDVLLRGESVLTDVYQAVYMKGRVSWDNKGIDRYALSHPEVLQFRKEGEPSVALRAAAKR